MSTDIQQTPAAGTGQLDIDSQTNKLLESINEYVRQFDAGSSAEGELPEIDGLLHHIDATITPCFQAAQQQARASAETTQARDAQRGADLKKEALEHLSEFQSYVYQVVRCFLKGYHYKAQMLRGIAEAKSKLGNIQIDNPGEVDDVLAKKRREKYDLAQLLDFIENARTILNKVETDAENLEQGLQDVLGKDGGDAALRAIFSKLRKQDFKGAASAAKEIKNKRGKGLGKFKSGQLPELAKAAEKLVTYYKDNSERLFTDDNRSFLRIRELDLAQTQARKEYDTAEGYLRKYYIAYLISKRQSLEQARERLKTMGSPEAVLNQHRRLIDACGERIADTDAAYNFESRHVAPMKQTISEQSGEIQRVEQRLERFMSEFNAVMNDIADYEEAMVE